eukprot:CAMPEP_0167826170 /NCGR_PEP_ID=MMETSP0112_2-20121227/9852_1 /TAXON_ID=91324 /ORGANISM="Lotharella globosa, Strain CCCM811" /LENGTH=142 /DNA_ID=CAMNT_0007728517 /DNA_START=154 /DNA_END=582 /DNA_ORIENTATION=-
MKALLGFGGGGLALAAPPDDGRPPRESGAEPRKGYYVPFLHLPRADRLVQRQWHGSCASISVFINVPYDLVHAETKLLRDYLHYPNVSLMQEQVIQIVRCQPSILKSLIDHTRDFTRSELVYLLSVHCDRVVAPFGRLVSAA